VFLAYPLGVLEKSHETVGLLAKYTMRGYYGQSNIVGGTVTEKGWEPLM
jgi:hypothetical protein